MPRKKNKRTFFTVEGAGAFPYDMLRYDHCFPVSEAETPLLSDNEFVGLPGLRRIQLATDSEYAPTEGRWRSFSWQVVVGSVTHERNY